MVYSTPLRLSNPTQGRTFNHANYGLRLDQKIWIMVRESIITAWKKLGMTRGDIGLIIDMDKIGACIEGIGDTNTHPPVPRETKDHSSGKRHGARQKVWGWKV